MECKYPTAVLVDLDGTLFDTVAVNAASYRRALEEVGFTVTDEYYAKHCNGKNYRDFLPPILEEYGDDLDMIEQIHDHKKAYYSQCLGSARKNEALFAILDAMRPMVYLGLVTTGSRQNATEILDHFGCRDWFHLIVTSEDVDHNKPDPEGYLQAMELLGSIPETTVIFEDSPTGLAAARATGAAVFAVDRF